MRNPDCIQTDMGGLAAEYMRDMFVVRASLASDSQYRGSEDHLKLIERMSRTSDKNDVLRDEMSAAGGTVPSSLSTMPVGARLMIKSSIIAVSSVELATRRP